MSTKIKCDGGSGVENELAMDIGVHRNKRSLRILLRYTRWLARLLHSYLHTEEEEEEEEDGYRVSHLLVDWFGLT